MDLVLNSHLNNNFLDSKNNRVSNYITNQNYNMNTFKNNLHSNFISSVPSNSNDQTKQNRQTPYSSKLVYSNNTNSNNRMSINKLSTDNNFFLEETKLTSHLKKYYKRNRKQECPNPLSNISFINKIYDFNSYNNENNIAYDHDHKDKKEIKNNDNKILNSKVVVPSINSISINSIEYNDKIQKNEDHEDKDDDNIKTINSNSEKNYDTNENDELKELYDLSYDINNECYSENKAINLYDNKNQNDHIGNKDLISEISKNSKSSKISKKLNIKENINSQNNQNNSNNKINDSADLQYKSSNPNLNNNTNNNQYTRDFITFDNNSKDGNNFQDKDINNSLTKQMLKSDENNLNQMSNTNIIEQPNKINRLKVFLELCHKKKQRFHLSNNSIYKEINLNSNTIYNNNNNNNQTIVINSNNASVSGALNNNPSNSNININSIYYNNNNNTTSNNNVNSNIYQHHQTKYSLDNIINLVNNVSMISKTNKETKIQINKNKSTENIKDSKNEGLITTSNNDKIRILSKNNSLSHTKTGKFASHNLTPKVNYNNILRKEYSKSILTLNKDKHYKLKLIKKLIQIKNNEDEIRKNIYRDFNKKERVKKYNDIDYNVEGNYSKSNVMSIQYYESKMPSITGSYKYNSIDYYEDVGKNKTSKDIKTRDTKPKSIVDIIQNEEYLDYSYSENTGYINKINYKNNAVALKVKNNRCASKAGLNLNDHYNKNIEKIRKPNFSINSSIRKNDNKSEIIVDDKEFSQSIQYNPAKAEIINNSKNRSASNHVFNTIKLQKENIRKINEKIVNLKFSMEIENFKNLSYSKFVSVFYKNQSNVEKEQDTTKLSNSCNNSSLLYELLNYDLEPLLNSTKELKYLISNELTYKFKIHKEKFINTFDNILKLENCYIRLNYVDKRSNSNSITNINNRISNRNKHSNNSSPLIKNDNTSNFCIDIRYEVKFNNEKNNYDEQGNRISILEECFKLENQSTLPCLLNYKYSILGNDRRNQSNSYNQHFFNSFFFLLNKKTDCSINNYICNETFSSGEVISYTQPDFHLRRNSNDLFVFDIGIKSKFGYTCNIDFCKLEVILLSKS